MNQELISLAKNKPFEFIGYFYKEWVHHSKEPLRWLFWMTELQQWLRDTYGLSVEVHGNSVDELYAYKIHFIGQVKISTGTSPMYDDYELALEYALISTLKLIIRYGIHN